MAESAVYQLISKLSSFLQQEINLLSEVREQIESIKNEFGHMTAFLRVADAMEETNPDVKVWVKQVRDAAYDIEDVLDKFKLRFARHHSGGLFGPIRKVSHFLTTLKARHQIASQVRRVKSRVEEISNGHQRYRDRYGMPQEPGRTSNVCNRAWYDSRGDALLVSEAELVGIEKPKTQLIQWLIDGHSRLKVVSVAGMGGLGKTTLTKRVYDDGTVKKHFESHVWITVSESFKIDELLKGMVKQLFEEIKQEVPEGVATMNTNGLKGMINCFLQEKRYVLVFDDIWDIQSWQAFRYIFPDCNNGSRVLITTRNAALASLSSRESQGYVYDLHPLSPEESWTLFCRKTFQGNSCPPHLEEISKRILTRCEGLPLAIVAVSGLLSIKNDTIDEWERIYRSLGVELEDNDILQSMKKILLLSYTELPYHLKLCFLYLSIFPEDCFMDHWRLIRLWVAEGLIEMKEGMTLEEVADGYLKELVSRSLLQVAEFRRNGRVKSYRIHDLMREIIISRSIEQNVVTIVSRKQRRWPDKVRRLSIHNFSESVAEKKGERIQLRSLFVFDNEDSPSLGRLPGSSNGGLRLLKVLDLRGAPLESLPNGLGELRSLYYLSLRGTKVKIIPRSIGQLKNLETLDLKYTYIVGLPNDILKLQRLRHLLFYRYEKSLPYSLYDDLERGFKPPKGIGSLSSLQKLSSIEVDDDNGSVVLRELGKLTQLRRLTIRKFRSKDGNVLCSSLDKLSNLHALDVSTTGESEIIDLNSLSSPPQLLRQIDLFGSLERLPQWLPSLHSLEKVMLTLSNLTNDDPVQSLQALPNLVYLWLDQAYLGEGLCFRAGGFQRLKVLWLARLQGLRKMEVEDNSMPLVEELYIHKCELLEDLPSGVQRLTNLKYLDLSDMSDELISSLDKNKQGRNYWKIAHIPRVWLGHSKAGYWQGYYL